MNFLWIFPETDLQKLLFLGSFLEVQGSIWLKRKINVKSPFPLPLALETPAR